MSTGIASANPAVSHTLGSDATGTASPADSFTEFLENEDKAKDEGGATRRERKAAARERQREAPQDGADDGDEGQSPEARQPKRERAEGRDEGKAKDDPLRDPVLDGDAPESDEEDEDGDDEADDEGPDDAEDDGADDDDDDGDDEDPEFDVTVNGVVSKVKQSELIASYSREADYRQKTATLAEERTELEAYAAETVERAQRYEQGIQIYEDLIAAVMPSQAEWDALKATNPTAFITAQEQWGGFLQKVEAAKAERERLAGEKSTEEGRNYDNYVRQENRKLAEKVPQLSDPKMKKAFADSIIGYGAKMGYSKEEMSAGLVNHRDVLTAYYASRYLQILESRNANSKAAKAKAPRTSEGNSNPRPVQTPKGRQQARRAQTQRRADSELARTGTQQSAAKSFAAMFE